MTHLKQGIQFVHLACRRLVVACRTALLPHLMPSSAISVCVHSDSVRAASARELADLPYEEDANGTEEQRMAEVLPEARAQASRWRRPRAHADACTAWRVELARRKAEQAAHCPTVPDLNGAKSPIALRVIEQADGPDGSTLVACFKTGTRARTPGCSGEPWQDSGTEAFWSPACLPFFSLPPFL